MFVFLFLGDEDNMKRKRKLGHENHYILINETYLVCEVFSAGCVVFVSLY